MWFLPKCDNVKIVNPLNHKLVWRLESKKGHDEWWKNEQKKMAKRANFSSICMMAGIG